jgi:DNA-binding transcriptional MerR regulator
MRIGAAAAMAGVTIQTFRYYERVGVLAPPARRPSGYREYSDEAVHLVRFVKRAQGLGFTLDEAKVLADLRRTPGRNRLQARERAQQKLTEIELRLKHLRSIRRALSSLVRKCCRSGDATCPILDALDA